MGTVFQVSNTGSLPIEAVRYVCVSENLNDPIRHNTFSNSTVAPEGTSTFNLDPGGFYSLDCDRMMIGLPDLRGTIQIKSHIAHSLLGGDESPVFALSVNGHRTGSGFGSESEQCSGYRFRARSDSQLPSAVHPPSTASVWPLMNPLNSGSARKQIACAISSGAANRPIGTRPPMSASV